MLKLKKLNYDAFLIEYLSSNKKKWYKICIGRFTKQSLAKKLMTKLKKRERKKDCFLTNLP